MSQDTQRKGVWSKTIITLVVVVWIGVAIGHWLARDVAVEKLGLNDETSGEISVPVERPKPWRGNTDELQKELDQENSGALRGEGQDSQLIVATPVATDNEEKAQESGQEEPAAGADSSQGEGEAVSEGPCYLQFASFDTENSARSLLTQLTIKGIDAQISVADGNNGKAYRVIGNSYPTRSEAEVARKNCVSCGFDAVIMEDM